MSDVEIGDDDIQDDPLVVMQDNRDFLAEIVRRLGGRATPREVHRRQTRFRYIGATAWVLGDLVAHGQGHWEDRPTGARGGRPTKVFVLVTDETSVSANRPNGAHRDERNRSVPPPVCVSEREVSPAAETQSVSRTETRSQKQVKA